MVQAAAAKPSSGAAAAPEPVRSKSKPSVVGALSPPVSKKRQVGPFAVCAKKTRLMVNSLSREYGVRNLRKVLRSRCEHRDRFTGKPTHNFADEATCHELSDELAEIAGASPPRPTMMNHRPDFAAAAPEKTPSDHSGFGSSFGGGGGTANWHGELKQMLRGGQEGRSASFLSSVLPREPRVPENKLEVFAKWCSKAMSSKKKGKTKTTPVQEAIEEEETEEEEEKEEANEEDEGDEEEAMEDEVRDAVMAAKTTNPSERTTEKVEDVIKLRIESASAEADYAPADSADEAALRRDQRMAVTVPVAPAAEQTRSQSSSRQRPKTTVVEQSQEKKSTKKVAKKKKNAVEKYIERRGEENKSSSMEKQLSSLRDILSGKKPESWSAGAKRADEVFGTEQQRPGVQEQPPKAKPRLREKKKLNSEADRLMAKLGRLQEHLA